MSAVTERNIHLFGERFLFLGLLIGSAATLFQCLLLGLKFAELPPLVPFWYTQPWGGKQLASPQILWLLPLLSLTILAFNACLLEVFLRRREKAVGLMVLGLTLFVVFALNFSLFRIIRGNILPAPLPWFLEQRIILPFLFSSLAALFLTPLTVKLAGRWGAVDDPKTHRHPAMLLKKPTARMGALPVFLSLLLAGLIFVPKGPAVNAIFLGTALAVFIGVLDDKYDLNPYFRLGALFLAAAVPVVAGISITFIGNPFGDVFRLDLWRTPFNIWGARPIILPADLLTIVWIVWLMNMLSWSNGVDGQFPGVVAIAAVTIGLLGKRFVTVDPNQWPVIILSFVTAGAVLGTLPFTWHPSSILYGFGATSLGLILACLAILSVAKVATSTLILMVPVLDALFVILRRIKHGHSPVWGDRGHLHHKLLDLGWGQRPVALFYWALTALFSLVSLYASGRGKILALLTAGGLAAFILTLANFGGRKIPRVGGKLWRR